MKGAASGAWGRGEPLGHPCRGAVFGFAWTAFWTLRITIKTLTGHFPPPRPQAQVSTFKRENEALRCGQGASLMVVKQNTEVALQNLRVVMNSAHTSIK